MDYAYQAQGWETLYSMVGGAAAALTGLLFIALSLNVQHILKSPSHRGRAREVFGGTLSLLVISILMLIPGQRSDLLGLELIAIALFLLVVTVILQSQTLSQTVKEHRLRWFVQRLPLNLATCCGLVAGISLLLKQYGGLFWLVPLLIVYVIWAINNAWLLVIQVAMEQEKQP